MSTDLPEMAIIRTILINKYSPVYGKEFAMEASSELSCRWEEGFPFWGRGLPPWGLAVGKGRGRLGACGGCCVELAAGRGLWN